MRSIKAWLFSLVSNAGKRFGLGPVCVPVRVCVRAAIAILDSVLYSPVPLVRQSGVSPLGFTKGWA